jgi:hypothetical protein
MKALKIGSRVRVAKDRSRKASIDSVYINGLGVPIYCLSDGGTFSYDELTPENDTDHIGQRIFFEIETPNHNWDSRYNEILGTFESIEDARDYYLDNFEKDPDAILSAWIGSGRSFKRLEVPIAFYLTRIPDEKENDN